MFLHEQSFYAIRAMISISLEDQGCLRNAVLPQNTNGQHSTLVATGWLYAIVSDSKSYEKKTKNS